MAHGEGWHFGAPGTVAGACRQDLAHPRREILHPAAEGRGRGFAGGRHPVGGRCSSRPSALEMYRQRFGAHHAGQRGGFPGAGPRVSARHALLPGGGGNVVAHHFRHPPWGSFRGRGPPEQRLGRLRSELDYAAIQEIIGVGLHEFLDRFQFKLNQVDDEIFNTFFALRPVSGARARRAPEPDES